MSFGSLKNLAIYQAKQSLSEFKTDSIEEASTQTLKTTESDLISHKQSDNDETSAGDQVQEKNVSLTRKVSEFSEESKRVQKVKKVELKSEFATQTPMSSPPPSTVSKASLEIYQLYETAKKEERSESTGLNQVSEETEAKIASLLFQDFLEGGDRSESSVAAATAVSQQQPKTDANANDELNGSISSLNVQIMNRAESNQSISSTLTNSSQNANNSTTVLDKQQQLHPSPANARSREKLSEEDLKEQIEALPEWIKLNAHVIVSTNTVQNKRGHVRYIGSTKFGAGVWIGVELEMKFGKNDGSVKGEKYFACGEEKGVFVRADKLSLVVNRVSDD